MDLILIIDKPDVSGLLFQSLLKKNSGAKKIVNCQNGLEALNFLKTLQEEGEKLPDYIFFDINLPIVGGVIFLHEYELLVTNINSLPQLYILHNDQNKTDFRKMLANSKIEGYLCKPITESKILELIDNNRTSQE